METRQVPIPFGLTYDPSMIDSEHDYAVKATIRSGGEVLFATEAGQPVITKNHPRQVDLQLIRATGGGQKP